MADLTDQKFSPGSVLGESYPVHQSDSPWGQLRPLPTVGDLKSDHLWGIPLKSRTPDERGKYQIMPDKIVQDMITKSVGTIETLSHLRIAPAQIKERMPFVRTDYLQLGFVRLRERPISSIVRLAVTMANDDAIYVVPQEWISTAHIDQGQLNLIPQTLVTESGGVVTSAAGAAAFLATLSVASFIPAWWECTYTVGFVDGLVPSPLWDAIACQAAMDVLSRLAATIEQNSGSLGIDGLSQSSSGPGPQLYDVAKKDLQERRDMVVRKFRKNYGKIFVIGTL